MSTATASTLPRTRNGRPRLKRTDDVLDYWCERIALVAPEREHFSYSSMICKGDRLFHYGEHFELARIMRDKRGRTRLVLLNGDTWGSANGFGPSTSSRQADVRRAVSQTNATSLVVPFSALEGAGIDFDSIMPVHVRSDRHTTEEHSSRQRPAKLAKMADPSGATRTESYTGYSDAQEWGQLTREVPLIVDDPNRTGWFSSEHGSCEGATRGEDGVWRWEVRRHWLGDSLFRARSTETRTRRPTAEELADDELARAWDAEMNLLGHRLHRTEQLRWQQMRKGGRRDYRRTARLALAEEGVKQAIAELHERPAPISRVHNGRVPFRVTRWATYLSSFDYQESRPLYFLCELPYRAKANTVDEAVEALKPPEVIAALARGLNVIRQGDLFAIPTKLTKRQIRRMRGRQDFTKRLRVLGTNHSVTEGIVLKGGAVLGRGIMRHEPESWRPPDHKRQPLGDAWHLLVRNTVPRTH